MSIQEFQRERIPGYRAPQSAGVHHALYMLMQQRSRIAPNLGATVKWPRVTRLLGEPQDLRFAITVTIHPDLPNGNSVTIHPHPLLP